MDMHNLATVITPNILKEKAEKAGMDESSFLAIEAVNSLIEYNDQMCEVCCPRRNPFIGEYDIDISFRSPKTSNPFSTTLLYSVIPQKSPPKRFSNVMAILFGAQPTNPL